ncbi:HEAT repeat domain-containing protein [Tunturiibacter lichenicola]|uniref:HEAT repeat domain-containing protein n=1 Tax=Tunturiibacter lichenicola TaxID=2051959 RepID=UPI0021B1CFE7|nr:HEAT repeat domain-containing protein [Edaphobacter lichenicola]
MKCESARDCIVLLKYGELPDELAGTLEQHLMNCEGCSAELDAFQEFEEHLAALPVLEPSPNLLAQSRMRLDDALDMIPPRGFLAQLRTNVYRWIGHVQSAPALATLLLGVGFLAGNFTLRYQVAHAPKPAPVVTVTHPDSVIANVTGIVQTPNSELVQVNYNRVTPETMEGSLDSPEIRKLLMVGTSAAATPGVRMNSVSLLTSECMAGHECQSSTDGKGIRHALMVSLRYDQDAGVRMKALEGLQRYVAQDTHVRDAVLEAVANDADPQVRQTAIGVLGPVQSDSSVRQVLRTVSTQDANPYIRTASYQALQGSPNIQ